MLQIKRHDDDDDDVEEEEIKTQKKENIKMFAISHSCLIYIYNVLLYFFIFYYSFL